MGPLDAGVSPAYYRHLQGVIPTEGSVVAQISLKLPDGLLARVDETAVNRGVSRSAWIIQTLEGAVADGNTESPGNTEEDPDPVIPASPGNTDEIDAKLLALVPCTAREFSDGGHALGLRGKALGARKLALGIETYRAPYPGGDWQCRVA